MKKNQSGVSMVSLVITIIVIIILAAVAFSGSQETIGRAGFSGFTTDIDSVRTAFLTENIPNLIGQEMSKNNAVSEPQAYNFLAKGATTTAITAEDAAHTWLSRAQAAAIPCTRIEKETAKDAIGIDLPERTVNTFAATGVEVSYFVTNKGDIFVWPPYARSDDGLFYVNDVVTVKTPSGEDLALTAAAAGAKTFNGTEISGDDEEFMYLDGFKFEVNGVVIEVKSANEVAAADAITGEAATSDLPEMPSVYYVDERNAESPEGIESKYIYNDREDTASTIAGVDED